uniref:Uncharacterized protein n=2 Tax=Bradyrhizobium amphicarpaeae TaxID=1404768 RepID=A0A2U8PLF6_9BRAD|nr:hypothetical protein CIT40_00145 [Bradyrhizobium amphicarpaeae]
MRFAVAFVSAQVLASTAFAEVPSDKMVTTLDSICVAPTSSEAMMAAGEKTAIAGNWKSLRSGPAPMPIMHNENGPKMSFESAWDLGAGASLTISIVRPEQPGLKYDICLIKPAAHVDSEELTAAIARQFGSTLTKDTSGRFKNQEAWFFTQEKARGNCGKQVIFSRGSGQPEALIFTNFAYPNDGQWDVMAKHTTRCPTQ